MWSELTSLGHFQDSIHSSGILNARAIKESGLRYCVDFIKDLVERKVKINPGMH